MTFAERLRELRIEKGLTLEDVARRLGVGRANIYKYEHGKIVNIPPEKIHMLADFFGVTRPYLMGWTDERSVNPEQNLEMVAEQLRRHTEKRIETDTPYWRTKEMNESDCITSATQAMRALIKYKIARTPIYPHQIIQNSDIVMMVSFEEADELDNILQNTKLAEYGRPNRFVMSTTYTNGNRTEYLFSVNRSVPIGNVRLALAVELGHAYLGHSGAMMGSYKYEREAECFALHLEFPRPMIRLLQERGYVMTKRRFERIFGDCDWCAETIRNAVPVHVSPELNRLVKEQFVPYVDKLERTGILSMPVWSHEELDLSRYMAGYED